MKPIIISIIVALLVVGIAFGLLWQASEKRAKEIEAARAQQTLAAERQR